MTKTRWYTINEGSVILKVDEETLRRLYRNGYIPEARKVGRQIRIPASFIEGDVAAITEQGRIDSQGARK